jgi:hypothetical protein
MIRLNPLMSAKWVDLVPGMSVLIEPIGTMILKEAGASDRVKSLSKDNHMDVNYAHFVVAVAQVAITDWKGVEDDTGTPAPVTHAYIAALMDIHPVYLKFAEIVAKSLTMVAEKNG